MNGDRNWVRLAWGIILIALGGLLVMERLDWLPPWAWHYQWWALFVIALGLVRLVRPRRAKHVGEGVLFVLLGAWFLVASNGIHGLGWHNSWPLALVAVGAGTVARAVAARWLPDARWVLKEEHHG